MAGILDPGTHAESGRQRLNDRGFGLPGPSGPRGGIPMGGGGGAAIPEQQEADIRNYMSVATPAAEQGNRWDVLQAGGYQLGEGLAALASLASGGNFGEDTRQWFAEKAQEEISNLSPELQADLGRRWDEVSENSAWTDPGAVWTQLVMQIPNLASMIIPAGGGAIQGARVAGKAAKGAIAAKNAARTAAGKSELSERVVKRIERMAKRHGSVKGATIGGGVGEGGVATGFTFDEALNNIEAMSHEELMASSPDYADLIQTEGLSPEEAKDEIKWSIKTASPALGAGAVSAILGSAGGRLLGELPWQQAGTGNVIKRKAKSVAALGAREAGLESLQEGSEQIASNIATPGKAATDDLANAMIGGGVLGGLATGPLGLLGGKRAAISTGQDAEQSAAAASLGLNTPGGSGGGGAIPTQLDMFPENAAVQGDMFGGEETANPVAQPPAAIPPTPAQNPDQIDAFPGPAQAQPAPVAPAPVAPEPASPQADLFPETVPAAPAPAPAAAPASPAVAALNTGIEAIEAELATNWGKNKKGKANTSAAISSLVGEIVRIADIAEQSSDPAVRAAGTKAKARLGRGRLGELLKKSSKVNRVQAKQLLEGVGKFAGLRQVISELSAVPLDNEAPVTADTEVTTPDATPPSVTVAGATQEFPEWAYNFDEDTTPDAEARRLKSAGKAVATAEAIKQGQVELAPLQTGDVQREEGFKAPQGPTATEYLASQYETEGTNTLEKDADRGTYRELYPPQGTAPDDYGPQFEEMLSGLTTETVLDLGMEAKARIDKLRNTLLGPNTTAANLRKKRVAMKLAADKLDSSNERIEQYSNAKGSKAESLVQIYAQIASFWNQIDALDADTDAMEANPAAVNATRKQLTTRIQTLEDRIAKGSAKAYSVKQYELAKRDKRRAIGDIKRLNKEIKGLQNSLAAKGRDNTNLNTELRNLTERVVQVRAVMSARDASAMDMAQAQDAVMDQKVKQQYVTRARLKDNRVLRQKAEAEPTIELKRAALDGDMEEVIDYVINLAGDGQVDQTLDLYYPQEGGGDTRLRAKIPAVVAETDTGKRARGAIAIANALDIQQLIALAVRLGVDPMGHSTKGPRGMVKDMQTIVPRKNSKQNEGESVTEEEFSAAGTSKAIIAVKILRAAGQFYDPNDSSLSADFKNIDPTGTPAEKLEKQYDEQSKKSLKHLTTEEWINLGLPPGFYLGDPTTVKKDKRTLTPELIAQIDEDERGVEESNTATGLTDAQRETAAAKPDRTDELTLTGRTYVPKTPDMYTEEELEARAFLTEQIVMPENGSARLETPTSEGLKERARDMAIKATELMEERNAEFGPNMTLAQAYPAGAGGVLQPTQATSLSKAGKVNADKIYELITDRNAEYGPDMTLEQAYLTVMGERMPEVQLDLFGKVDVDTGPKERVFAADPAARETAPEATLSELAPKTTQMQLPFEGESKLDVIKRKAQAKKAKPKKATLTLKGKKKVSKPRGVPGPVPGSSTESTSRILGWLDRKELKDAVESVTTLLHSGEDVSIRDLVGEITFAGNPFPEGSAPHTVLSILSQYGENVKVVKGNTGTHVGEYDLKTREITISENLIDAYMEYGENKTQQEILLTLMHEGVHAMSMDNILSDKQYRKNMQRLMNAAIESNPDLAKKYGFTNVAEFIAEGFVNADFQTALAETIIEFKVDGKTRFMNAFMGFINSIADALGFDSINKKSALYALFNYGSGGIIPTTNLSGKPVTGRSEFPHHFWGDANFDAATLSKALEEEREQFAKAEGQKFRKRIVPNEIYDGNLARIAFDDVKTPAMEALDAGKTWMDAANGRPLRHVLTTTDNLVLKARKFFKTKLKDGTLLDPVKWIDDARNLAVTIATKIHHEVRGYDRQFTKLGDKQANLQDLMKDSTMNNMFPYADAPPGTGVNSHIKNTAANRRVHEKLVKQFKALGGEGRALYKDMVKFTSKMVGESKKALILRASHASGLQEMAAAEPKVYGHILEKFLKARTKTQLEAVRKSIPDEGLADDVYKMATHMVTDQNVKAGPYFPLRRYGDYIVSATKIEDPVTYATRDEAVAAAEAFEDEAVTNKATVVGNTVQYEGEYYAQFDKPLEAKREAERLTADGYHESQVSYKIRPNTQLTGKAADLARMLTRDLYKNKSGKRSDMDEKLRKHLDTMLLEMLAMNPAAASQLQRKGVAGANSGQMFRAFAEYGWASGWQIADSSTTHTVDRGYREMKKLSSAKTANEVEATRANQDTILNRGYMLAEFMRRDDANMNERRSKTGAIVGRMGFAFYLANFAYPLQNATQVWLLGMPYLASRYGTAKSAKAIMGAYKKVNTTVFGAVVDVAKSGFKGTEEDVFDAVMKELRTNHPKDAAIVQRMADLNIIEATFVQELMDTVTGQRETPMGKNFEKGMEIARLLPASVEIINRMVMTIAAADLNGETATPDANGEIHLDKTAEAVRQTQLDYRKVNKPPAFRGTIVQAVFMFKMYPLGVYNLLGKATGAALRGATPEERAQGIKQLAWMMGGHTLAAGVAGGVLMEPVRFFIWGVMSMLGLDEEDEGIEAKMRRALVDDVGVSPATVDVLMYGVGSAVGANLSPKLGLASLSIGRIYSDSEDALLAQSMGPVYSAGKNIAKGMGLVASGDIAKGMSKMLPIGVLRDFSKAYMYGTDGITTLRGNPVLSPDSISPYEMVMAAAGWQPVDVATAYEAKNTAYNLTVYWEDNASSIRNEFAKAKTPAQWLAANKKLAKHNIEAPPSFRMGGQGLSTAIREFAKRKALTKQGIYSDHVEIAALSKYYDSD